MLSLMATGTPASGPRCLVSGRWLSRDQRAFGGHAQKRAERSVGGLDAIERCLAHLDRRGLPGRHGVANLARGFERAVSSSNHAGHAEQPGLRRGIGALASASALDKPGRGVSSRSVGSLESTCEVGGTPVVSMAWNLLGVLQHFGELAHEQIFFRVAQLEAGERGDAFDVAARQPLRHGRMLPWRKQGPLVPRPLSGRLALDLEPDRWTLRFGLCRYPYCVARLSRAAGIRRMPAPSQRKWTVTSSAGVRLRRARWWPSWRRTRGCCIRAPSRRIAYKQLAGARG